MNVHDLTIDRNKLVYAWFLCQIPMYRKAIGQEMVEWIAREINRPGRYRVN